jgi:hypothetical protein
MSAESALHSPIGPLLLGTAGLEEGDMLLLHLLYEARNRSSPYRPHLCTLPRTIPLPAFMRPGTLVEMVRAIGITPTTFNERVQRVRMEMAAQHARIAPLLRKHPEAFPPASFSSASLAWGAAILRSRTWRTPPASNASPTDSGAIAAAPAWRAAGMRLLVPVADMANHDGTRGQPALLRRPAGSGGGGGGGGGGGDVILWTAGGLRAGEELSISYGDKCPLDLLINYGFLPPADAAIRPACADPAAGAAPAEGIEPGAGGSAAAAT